VETGTMTFMADPPLASALEAVGDRWTLLVIDALLNRPMKFGELQAAIPGVAPNTLSQRLQHLDRESLVVARPYQERPPRFTYALTEQGRQLAGALHMLAEWGARRSGAELPRHATCGSQMETRFWCPTCARVVEPDEASDARVL